MRVGVDHCNTSKHRVFSFCIEATSPAQFWMQTYPMSQLRCLYKSIGLSAAQQLGLPTLYKYKSGRSLIVFSVLWHPRACICHHCMPQLQERA